MKCDYNKLLNNLEIQKNEEIDKIKEVFTFSNQYLQKKNNEQ